MLVGVVLGKAVEEILQQIEELKGKVDLAEVRLDYLDESAWPKIGWLKEKACLPLLFTFRKKEQGGRFALEEKKRLALYEKALSLQPAYADIEADTDPAFIRNIKHLSPQTILIGSFHDLEKTPEDLSALLKSMHNPHFSLYKIAVYANSTLDLMRLMVFAREMTKTVPLSCISLGPYGQSSRVLGPIVGNVLNYTSFQDALGFLYQYSLDTLQNLYGFSHLTKETKIYALLGTPVEPSQGHLFHNEYFRRENIHAVYVKLRLGASELKSFFSLAKKLPFGGFSVTMPLKEAVIPFLTQVDPEALSIGAVNTIVIRGSDLSGFNTDGKGALNALEVHEKVRGKKVAILGAGGSAKAIAYEALRRGAEVMLFNRTLSRAEHAAKKLGCKAYALDALSAHPYDCLINTIPPHSSGQLPVLTKDLLPNALLMDINPVTLSPPLLRFAKENNRRCLDGSLMFEEQARLQQLAFNS